MYSQAPRTCTNGGPLGESSPSSIKGVLGFEGFRGQIPSAENCDPNLVPSRGGPRKARSPMGREESCKSTRNDRVPPSPTPEAGVPSSMNEAGSGLEQQVKEEANRPAKSVPSPTKVSGSPQQHSHGHRQHICRSPRCASNNPDYATPAQTVPRQYLISKRHLVPGAICTRDPAAVSNRSRESITPPAPSTTSKPPKPVRKIENAMRQPSFADVLEAKSSPSADAYPPTRIPKPPSARSPLKCGSPSNEPARLIASNATLLPLYRENVDRSSSNEFHDTTMTAGAAVEDRVEDLPRVNSDLSCSVLVASTSSRESDVGEISDGCHTEDNRLESSNRSAANAELELSTLEKMFLPSIKDYSGSRSSQCSSAAGYSSALSSSTELEFVTERLAQNLGLDREANAGWQVGERKSEDGLSRTNLDAQTKDEDKETARDVASEASRIETEMGTISCNLSFGQEKGNLSPDLRTGSTTSAEREDDINPEFRGEPSVRNAHISEELDNNILGLVDNFQSKEGCEIEKDSEIRSEDPVSSPSETKLEEEERRCGTSVANFISTFENSHLQEPGCQRGTAKFVRGKGRQLWRSDVRDSREVVFLKPTSPRDHRAGDWTVDGKLEGAIAKLNPSGQGRVRVLVEAFESLMNVGEAEETERRASRVWCLNRMEKGEVDEDGEEFEEGDQRVDCYEVSGDGLQLRASMRLSLGGGNRLPLCNPDEDESEIEMSAIEKVEDWDDDCGRSADSGNIETSSFKDLNREYVSSIDREETVDQDECNREQFDGAEFKLEGHQRSTQFEHSAEPLFDELSYSSSDRSSEDVESAKGSALQFGCYSGYDLKQKIDDLDIEYKFKASRRRRFWKPARVKPVSVSPSPNSKRNTEKPERVIRGTLLEPFRLMTEERGVAKEYQFARMLEEAFMEEERQRNPIAQGLPWTTDEPQIVPKPPVKEQTRPVEFRHYSNSRAVERAEFDNYLGERTAYVHMQKQEKERLQHFIEQEEVKRLRREMVPRAQLMPYFDQPFVPTRSSKRLTVPKEPAFHNRKPKRAKCVVWHDRQHNQQQHQHKSQHKSL